MPPLSSSSICFANASSLTLLGSAPRVTRQTQSSPTPCYRISTTVCLATKRRARQPKKSPTSSTKAPASVPVKEQVNPSPGYVDPTEDLEDEPEPDPLLADPEDSEIAAWAAEEAVTPDDVDVPLEDLILDESASSTALGEDEELLLSNGFEDNNQVEDDEGDDEGDDDDDDDDDDEEEDEEEDDEFRAAVPVDDEFGIDPAAAVATGSTRRRSLSGRNVTDEPDENDEVDDEEEILEPIAEEPDPIFDPQSADFTNTDEPSLNALQEDESAGELFEEGTEEDIRSAADILSNSGLLGLGVEGGKGTALSVISDLAFDTEKNAQSLEEPVDAAAGDVGDGSAGDVVDEDENDIDESGQEGIVDESSEDEGEEEDFALTSQASYGRVWELNEDTYVTITDSGESYAYDLDEDDEEDQEMASVRRGKQGGWSGGLTSYPASDLPEGSKEWVARRSYELMLKATPVEMFRWTRRRMEPPSEIAALYPDDLTPPTPLGKRTLKLSGPEREQTPSTEDSALLMSSRRKPQAIDDVIRSDNPLERAVRFPCRYKFKVEGSGEGFPDCLRRIVETVLDRPVPDLEINVESNGRYQRVLIHVQVENAKQVTDLYDGLRSHPTVKFSYG